MLKKLLQNRKLSPKKIQKHYKNFYYLIEEKNLIDELN